MSSAVFRLIYGSRTSLPPRADLVAEVAGIVAVSRRNNAAVQVTGLLLHHGDVFVQALEGDRAAVETVYRRVAADPRHDRVRVVASGLAPHRLFGAWSMCARTLSPADAVLLDQLGAPEDLDPEFLDPIPTLNLLSAVSQVRTLDQAA